MAVASETPDARTFGSYQLIAKLAAGGMGEIFIARLEGAAGFQKLVVIKQLRAHLAEHPELVAMFVDEAHLAARISHSNVCQVHELGQKDGRYYIVMEYLEGVTLSRLAKSLAHPLDRDAFRLIAGLVSQVCDGLYKVHTVRQLDGSKAGVVHRDISPQNLFVTSDGIAKLLDFGVARDSRYEPEGRVHGKLAYMSPEQLAGAKLDARSDIYSLAIVVHELVTGQLPDSDATVEGAVGRVLARALAEDPDSRFDSARVFAEALTAALADHGPAMTVAEIATWVDAALGDEIELRRQQLAAVLSNQALPLMEAASQPTGTVDCPTIVGLAPGATTVTLDSAATESLQVMPGDATADGKRLVWLPVAILLLIGGGFGAWLLGREPSGPAPAPAAQARLDAGVIAVMTGADAAPLDASTMAGSGPTRDAAAVGDAGAKRGGGATHRPPARPSRVRDRRRSPESGVGYLTIESKPYATIYIDGQRADVTPILRRSVAAGRHRIRAVSSTGAEKTFSVVIEAGREAPRRKLTW